MIVATAGHVDHGKTTLVKALTGVDADRLPEEKARGMSIDLGFAYLPRAGGATIGFVDVPGHERFVHNMLCGVAGIDAVMFVVAADDGVMPQTREHLAILDLLGVKHGLVALTKTDRADPARVAAVEGEIARLAAGTSLAGMPVFPVAATIGEGVPALLAHLHALADTLPVRGAGGNFRLAVDRSFSISGAGLIVTGTVVSGRVETGSQVRTLLADAPARVRGIHAQNAAAESGAAGQRCALNLAGELKPAQIQRGDWVVQGEAPPPVVKLDARIRVPPGEKPLRHWTPVHAHLGAMDATGRVALLEGDAIAPGQSGLAQLVLDHPAGAAHGDRLILRDQAAQRTLAGGVVIDIYPPARGRAKPERIAALRANEEVEAARALAALLQCQPAGVDLAQFARNRNLARDEAQALFAQVEMHAVRQGEAAWGYTPRRWADLRTTALAALTAWHRANADLPGLIAARLFGGTGVRLPREAQAAITDELVREGRVLRTGTLLRLPGHQAEFNAADAALWKHIEALLRANAERPPAVAEIAAQLREAPKRVQGLLERAAKRGLLYRVSQTRFFLPATVARLAGIAQAIAEASTDHRVTVIALRDKSTIGRNVAVEVMEFFDRVGYTRRLGDERLVLKSAKEVFGDAV